MSHRTSALQPFNYSVAEGFMGLLDPQLDLQASSQTRSFPCTLSQ